MKKSIVSNIKLCISACIIAITVACQKDEIPNETIHTEITETPEVSMKNGFLRFKDQASFEKTRVALENLSLTEQAAWEEQFGDFKSQYTIYNELIENDLNYTLELEQLPATAIEQLKEEKGEQYQYDASVLAYQNLLSFEEDGGYILHVEGMARDIEKFIGSNGLLQIGDSIYHYGQSQIKVILDGDEQKIAELDTFSTSTENIQVQNFTRKIINVEILDKSFSGSMSCIAEKNKKKRIIGKTIFTSTSLKDSTCDSGFRLVGGAYLKVEYEKKSNGRWTNSATENLRIIGSNMEVKLGAFHFKNLRVDVSTRGKAKSYLIATIFGTDAGNCKEIGDDTLIFTGDVSFHGPKHLSCSI